jgi:hypothetical protein
MLRILGSAKTLCDGMTRRDMLRAGGLGVCSLGLNGRAGTRDARGADAAVKAGAAGISFGRAKRVMLLHLYGAAAQHETFDPKPEAPDEIRGIHKPIDTVVPGIQIDEHLPRIARIADRVTIVRSMSHPYNIHSVAYSHTGIDKVDIPMELDPYDVRHWPSFGSVVEYLQQHSEARRSGLVGVPPAGGQLPAKAGTPALGVPRNIALPFQFSSRSPQFTRGGPYGGFLGRSFNPIWTEFDGKATQVIDRWNGNQDVAVNEFHAGIEEAGRFTVSPAAQLRGEVTLDRLNSRRTLLEQLDDARRTLDASAATHSLDRFQNMAYSLMTSPQLREALDIHREPRALRDRYGMTLFGQATLCGRRLLEAGATVVSVFWDEITTANSAWDTHFSHFERLRDELLPGLDRALSSLILDLEERGMLDDTLVMCLTEHGRTPKLSSTPRGAGREHWSNVYCQLFAGGGIARGRVVGSSDKHGAFVKDDPVSPKDILCSAYHLLGIDPDQTIPDRLGRPVRLVSEGEVVQKLLA